MLVISLIFLSAAALGAVLYWRHQTPDRSLHTVVTQPHDKNAALSLTNLPEGSRLGVHNGRTAAVLKDGTVLAESAGGSKIFPSLAAYRDYVDDQKALLFADQPA